MTSFLPRRQRYRIIFYFSCLFLLFAFDLLSLVNLQLLKHDNYLHKANKQRLRKIMLNPKRGTIFDVCERELALSIDVDSVFAHPHQIEQAPKTARSLAPILKLSRREILAALRDDRSFVWLKRHISPHEREQIEALDLKGIDFIQESKRYYPKKFQAGHVLGFAGIDNHGLEGIELAYDKKLKGSEGWYYCNIDARNRAILTQQLWKKMPTAGTDIVLTIDEVVQYFTEKELNKVCTQEKAKSGTAIVMDPRTGAILALANFPPFNPNNFSQDSASHWRTRGLVDIFEPGSTMKTIVFAAALEEKLIHPGSIFDCRQGSITYAHHRYHDWRSFGRLTAREVLAYSSNIGTFSIAERLGRQKLYSYLKLFGFGQKTGIDFPGEAQGTIYPPEKWSLLSVPSISIGYEVSVSAIQMVNAYACIANQGTMMTPRLVHTIRNDKGEILTYCPPLMQRQVISRKTAHIVKDLLHDAVHWGTGTAAAVPGYEVCGKTGTSKKYDHRRKTYSTQKVIASFIGFAPKDDPVAVIGVFLDEPRSNKWGSSAAAPVFKKITQQLLRYKRVKPDTLKTMILTDLGPYQVQLKANQIAQTVRNYSTASLETGSTVF